MDWSNALRTDLIRRAGEWCASSGAIHYKSLGNPPTILFEPSPDGSRHGNFQPDAWMAIQANAKWSERLSKPHSQQRALPEPKRATARELDSCTSSDALLMNCFCYPGGAEAILRGLELQAASEPPVFGFKPGLALLDGTRDTTEIDMKIGSLIFEAKLTEKDFTDRPKLHVSRYSNFRSCFDVDQLPARGDHYTGYQLIRNVLAAMELGAMLIVLLDQRRPDLMREWWSVHTAIKDPLLRKRCGFRTWQEVAAESADPLGEFLARKYGLGIT